MMAKVLYETEHKKAGHFRFGDNWLSYLQTMSPERLAIAEESLTTFLGGKKNIKGKTFLDLGSGSGLFSLAAYRLGAASIVSVDVDDASLECARFLKDRDGNPSVWQVKKASALNAAALKKLGQFDIVYSWGVLHHTGHMDQAIVNAAALVAPDGKLYISIYNHSKSLRHGTSSFWVKTKKRYNQSPAWVKQLYVAVYSTYLFCGVAASGRNPWRYIRDYQSMRGMSWKHDVLDWLGGDPYEFATPEAIVQRLSELGFTLQNAHWVQTIGCNEYLFVRNKPVSQLSGVTVLMSVHNSASTLDRTLTSLMAQTLVPNVVCINDASTDDSAAVLARWQKKVGHRLKIVVNKKNLGLTKSLNKGLALIKTPYTARIDADDWWEPTKLEQQVNFLEANPDYGIIGCWYTNYAQNRQFTVTPPITDAVIRDSLIYHNPFAHSCVMFRTKLMSGLGGYDPSVRYGQDYELWMRCLPQTKFFNLPQNLCHRSFVGGISVTKQHDQMRQAIQTRLKYIHTYHMPLKSYVSIIEPWLVSITPRWLADFKRRLVR